MDNHSPSDVDTWVVRLNASGPTRDASIVALRDYLVRGLTKSLGHRYGGHVPVEDIVQESLLKILQALDSYQGRSLFLTWAMSIAIRVGISSLRRHYYRDISLDLDSSEVTLGLKTRYAEASYPSMEDEKLAHLSLLEGLINQTLSDKQRIAIRGVLEGLPMEEIASRLHSNRNAVYKLVHDAKLRLRQGFEAHGIHAYDIHSSQ